MDNEDIGKALVIMSIILGVTLVLVIGIAYKLEIFFWQ